jgi:hypothetical protein
VALLLPIPPDSVCKQMVVRNRASIVLVIRKERIVIPSSTNDSGDRNKSTVIGINHHALHII